jgi:hypothetical protein
VVIVPRVVKLMLPGHAASAMASMILTGVFVATHQ